MPLYTKSSFFSIAKNNINYTKRAVQTRDRTASAAEASARSPANTADDARPAFAEWTRYSKSYKKQSAKNSITASTPYCMFSLRYLSVFSIVTLNSGRKSR